MKVIEETTAWDTDYAVPNHVYFVNDSKDKMFAYVAVGSVKVQEFAKPIKFSVSRRKFREVPNTWGYTVDEQPAGQTWKVAGSKGAEYVVTELDGVKTCTCSGFKFRGNCRHTSLVSTS